MVMTTTLAVVEAPKTTAAGRSIGPIGEITSASLRPGNACTRGCYTLWLLHVVVCCVSPPKRVLHTRS